MRRPRLALLAAIASLTAVVSAAAPADAAVLHRWPAEQVPPGHTLSTAQVVGIASATPEAQRTLALVGRGVDVRAGTYGKRRWQVEYLDRGDIVTEVHVDDRTGAVVERWTGVKALWRGARGSKALTDEGETGSLTNATWVWIVLSLAFVLPFIDPRRPFRRLHLDLALLLAFAISHVFLNHARAGWSIALAWPVLGLLAVRFVLLAVRDRGEHGAGELIPLARRWMLVAGLVVLIALRAAGNLADSVPADVAFAGVGGADRIEHGLDIYTAGGQRYDTYAPVNYLLYVPFEQVLPLRGVGDADLWAAHAASIAFDLLTALALFVLGTRLRRGPPGRVLGLGLAYAWTAYPYSWYALSWNTNDAAVPMLLVAAVAALSIPLLSGALLGLAAMTKFSPILAGGVMLRYVAARAGAAGAALFAAAAAVVALGTLVVFLPDGGLREVYDATIGFQLGRDSPFSPWGQLDWLEPLGVVMKAALVALFVASLLSRGALDRARACAWIAALFLTLQLGMSYWVETYIVWFAPFALVAIFAMHSTSALVSGANGATSRKHRAP